jgi:hypothetical protein
MKIADFQPLATEPAIFGVKWDTLREANIEVRGPDGAKLVANYWKLRQTLLDEGVIECDWRAPQAKILTGKGEYRQGHGPPADRATESVWQLLCLDCHLVTKCNSNVAHANWFFYERSHALDYSSTCDAFFVVEGDKIIDDRFTLFATPPCDRPSGRLLDAGVWEEIDPGQPSQATELWSNRPEWLVGWARAAYKHFYETTGNGRAWVMSPRAIRFDDLSFWVDDDTTPEPTPSELGGRIQALSSRLTSLHGLVKVALAIAGYIAGVLAIDRWLSK